MTALHKMTGADTIPARRMVNGGTTIHTADGSTVTITPRGIEYDLHVRNAKGETVATVEMSQDDLDALYLDMDEHTTVGWEAA